MDKGAGLRRQKADGRRRTAGGKKQKAEGKRQKAGLSRLTNVLWLLQMRQKLIQITGLAVSVLYAGVIVVGFGNLCRSGKDWDDDYR